MVEPPPPGLDYHQKQPFSGNYLMLPAANLFFSFQIHWLAYQSLLQFLRKKLIFDTKLKRLASLKMHSPIYYRL